MDAATIVFSIVNTLTTITLAALTFWYVRLTHRMLETMREEKEPFIDLEFDSTEMGIRCAVVNTGQRPARNIQFSVPLDCEKLRLFTRGEGDAGIASVMPFSSGIKYLPAGQRMIFPIGIYKGEGDSAHFMINIQFRNDEGKEYTRHVHVDFAHINSLLFESFKNNHFAVAEAIREASRELRRSESTFG